jgi:hypothetical protein
VNEPDAALRAGIAVYTAGGHHAAHDPWEAAWLDLPESPEKDLLQGLIGTAGAVHHAESGNREGAIGLARSAREYFDGLPGGFRGVNVGTLRLALSHLVRAPGRAAPPSITYRGEHLGPESLGADPEAALRAAVPLAESEGYDAEPVGRAVEYARDAYDAGADDDRFLRFILDFVADTDHRGTVYARLADSVSKRRAREDDVKNLF